MNEQVLKQWIKGDEGFSSNPYMDSTGHVSIGWGRNLDNGITVDEAELMFETDYNRSIDELKQYSWYLTAPEHVQFALVNMNFNLGIHKILTFTQMIEALINKDYKLAAQEALKSKWAQQVRNRAIQIADMMRGDNA
jgi:lysozyme